MDEKKLKKVQAAVRLGVNPTDALLLQKLIDVEELAVKLEQLLSGIDTGKLEYIKGDDGYTPIKGTDYDDGEDGYTPVKGKDYFDGEDGKTPTKDELVALIKPLIEKPEQVDTTALVKQVLDQVEVPEIDQKGILDALAAQIPQLGMSVRDALELLPEGEKLLTSSIEDKDGKNLDIIIEELKKQTGKTVFAGGGARVANQISVDTTNFAGNLSAADDTVQKALDTLDDMVGGGGGTWGSITGTLSNQTDLQSALDAKAASSHTHTASQITDFDTEVSNNTDVAANTAARHAAVTVTDSAEIDFTLTGQDITASLKAGSIDETKLDTSVNASLDLADSALQNIVEDTTPQLGGNLDTKGYTILGGTSTTADLTLQTTSGVGATGADMHFKVGNNGATEALTILNNGNVGIGTTTPISTLNVSSGTTSNPSLIADSGVFTSQVGNIQLQTGVITTSPWSYWMQVKSNLNNGSSYPLVLNPSGGNVGIGTTSPDSIKLDVEDDIEVGTGTTGCVRDSDNTTLVGTCVSDERLKKNIAPLPETLSALVLLEPSTFEWRNNEFDWLNGQEGTNFGLIAQDVELVFPDMVHTDDRGYKRVAYDITLTMRILQGVKELWARVQELFASDESQNARIATLEDEVANLKAQLAASNTAQNSTLSASAPVPPTITIRGENPAHIPLHAEYNDLGATATNAEGNELTVTLLVNGEGVSAVQIDTSVADTHTVTYQATYNGHVAEATRTVVVANPEPTEEAITANEETNSDTASAADTNVDTIVESVSDTAPEAVTDTTATSNTDTISTETSSESSESDITNSPPETQNP